MGQSDCHTVGAVDASKKGFHSRALQGPHGGLQETIGGAGLSCSSPSGGRWAGGRQCSFSHPNSSRSHWGSTAGLDDMGPVIHTRDPRLPSVRVGPGYLLSGVHLVGRCGNAHAKCSPDPLQPFSGHILRYCEQAARRGIKSPCLFASLPACLSV